MPHFNEFRTNELLLGQVLVAKQNFDFAASEDEHLEVRKFMRELEEQKRKEDSSLYLRLVSFLTGKKYVQIKDRFGNKLIREIDSDTELKPKLRISVTINRQVDFCGDVNVWKKYIHEENIRIEQRNIEKKARSEERKLMVAAYAESINKKMMKLI